MPGRIITFYSYKGGTGRSMALANMAWILASRGKKVLAIDWDLEAPGLHRYFRPFLVEPELSSTPGLIEFVREYAAQAMTPPSCAKGQEDPNWYIPFADITRYAVPLDWNFDGGCLHLVPAGKQDPHYG